MLRDEHKGYTYHDTVNDKINEFIDDLTRRQTVGDTACIDGGSLIVSRETLLGKSSNLQNTVAALESEICRLRKIKEEVAEESIGAIYRGLQE